MVNRWSLTVATKNGSGSQSANTILSKTLFRMGLPVGAKNLFPSNIQGLPTWFSIRVDDRSYVGRKQNCDAIVAMNAETFNQDLKQVRSGGFFIYNSDFKLQPDRNDIQALGVPFRDLVKTVTGSVKLAKLLTNTIYVGVLAEWMGIDPEILSTVVQDQFKDKESVIDSNLKAIQVGREFAANDGAAFGAKFTLKVQTITNANANKLFIDGNSAAALGLTFGGCSFMSWYPITPSSSLAESFQRYATRVRSDENSKQEFAVVQAEDELSAINMVLGAGWAGARAITATSGPGLSLMAEAAGLSYFAEIPSVIWNVQRAGPSTGLPTRTLQGDVSAAYRLSHGDTEHIVLLPGSAEECFEFGKVALDLAEEFQTLVIVLSDLDLGMNYHISQPYKVPLRLSRGKVLFESDLAKLSNFSRYADPDGDGVPYRTLPGLSGPKGGYFTRGTGHDEAASYSEDPEVFRKTLLRLKRKMLTAQKKLPKPLLEKGTSEIALISYGSSRIAMPEVIDLFEKATGKRVSHMCIRALPLQDEVFEFLAKHQRAYVIEQNRDGQVCSLLLQDSRLQNRSLKSVCVFDGLPLDAEQVSAELCRLEGNADV